MIGKKLVLKLAGGMFAVGIAVTALAGQPAQPADAACPPGQLCIPGGLSFKPDLRVESVNATKSASGTITYHALIKNHGLTDAGNYRVRLMLNGEVVYDYSQIGLNAGQPFGITVFLDRPELQKAQLVAVVDTLNQVDETNEGNNTASKLVNF